MQWIKVLSEFDMIIEETNILNDSDDDNILQWSCI
jgi:hypothetical protein